MVTLTSLESTNLEASTVFDNYVELTISSGRSDKSLRRTISSGG